MGGNGTAEWNRMERNHRTKHVFFVLCDSHRLQLLMKDIIEPNWLSSCFSFAQNIVTHFNHSPKQLAMLREKMRNAYGKTRTFNLSVFTRWGTQVNMIDSVSSYCQALQNLCQDTNCDTYEYYTQDFTMRTNLLERHSSYQHYPQAYS